MVPEGAAQSAPLEAPVEMTAAMTSPARPGIAMVASEGVTELVPPVDPPVALEAA